MSSLTPRLDKLDKNYIINGNFDYWQRNTSAVVTGGYSTADRFTTNHTGGSGISSRSTDVPNTNSTYSMQVAVTNATGPILAQRIESIFAKDLAGKTITLNFKVKAVDSTGVPIKVDMFIPDVADTYGTVTMFTTLVASANPTAGQWITYSAIVSIPATAVRGLYFYIYRDSGVTPATTTTLFSQLQILLGSNLDPDFSYAARNVLEELALCQRYYETTTTVATSVNYANNLGAAVVTFTKKKRINAAFAIPSIGASLAYSGVSFNSTISSTTDYALFVFNNAQGANVSGAVGFTYTASAEL